MSNNGYHVAVAYSTGIVLIWDLRKLDVIAILNQPTNTGNVPDSVPCVEFDNSGKYLAMAGMMPTNKHDPDVANHDNQELISIYITTVKEWGETAILHVPVSSMTNKSNKIHITGLTWSADNKITLVWDTSMNDKHDTDTKDVQIERKIVIFGEK
jgi:WD40 repeat protein